MCSKSEYAETKVVLRQCFGENCKDFVYNNSTSFTDTNTLLSVLYMYFENYDLKGAMTFVLSFIDTSSHDINLEHLLLTGDSLIQKEEMKITEKSSLKILQLSMSVKYPIIWLTNTHARPLVQQLAIFMSYYFTNHPINLPSHFKSSASLQHGRCTNI